MITPLGCTFPPDSARHHRGERRSQRFHETFVRRQGHLSERLSRRVKRIQTDHCAFDGYYPRKQKQYTP